MTITIPIWLLWLAPWLLMPCVVVFAGGIVFTTTERAWMPVFVVGWGIAALLTLGRFLP